MNEAVYHAILRRLRVEPAGSERRSPEMKKRRSPMQRLIIEPPEPASLLQLAARKADKAARSWGGAWDHWEADTFSDMLLAKARRAYAAFRLGDREQAEDSIIDYLNYAQEFHRRFLRRA